MTFQLQTLDWNEGERQMHTLMHAPDNFDNPNFPGLSPQLANHLRLAPLIAIGVLDSEDRPWTTLWGNGEKGFAQPVAEGGIIGIKTAVTGRFDPVVEELFGKEANGEVVREEGKGRMVSGLTLDLETRKRVKMYGRMIAGALSTREDEITDRKQHVAEVQLVLKIEQSLGNCPKYLNKKAIVPAHAEPELVSDSAILPQRAIDLIEKADLFFISSSNHQQDMDTNHRGGPPGFVRVVSNTGPGAVLCYPEYSGNRLYQTLGNLQVNPLAGLCIPDFETGDMLYLTGTTSIVVGQDAGTLLPRSNLAVKITLTSARYVSTALPFRGTLGDRSPYNPTIRYLRSERPPTTSTGTQQQQQQQATLLSQTPLTPTISRFTFSLENATTHTAGQYVTLDFSAHLDIGYSHMRDDDPRSINDDFVRTFTVSSPPGAPPNPVRRLKDDEFEITVRNVGSVTGFLFRHWGKESRERGSQELEVGVRGFGGDFEVRQRKSTEVIGFVAAGVGITPLLPSLGTVEVERLKVWWSVRKVDLPLIGDVLGQYPALGRSLAVFVTNAQDGDDAMEELKQQGVVVNHRRLMKSDFDEGLEGTDKYYLCTPVPMRKQLVEWLPGKEVIFEDFNF